MSESVLHFAQFNEDIPIIDLHVFHSIHEALDELENTLFSLCKGKNQGDVYCRIIHGIGSGVLADAVHNALKKNPLVEEWMEEETGGSCVVRLLVF